MNNFKRILSAIAISTVALGALFKIMHYPGSGLLLIVGLGCLSLLLSTLLIIGIFKSSEPGLSTVCKILSIVFGIILLMGVLFKIMHYPGSALLLLISLSMFAMIISPLSLISGLKSEQSVFRKISVTSGHVILTLLLLGFLFIVLHWPGAKTILILGIIATGIVWLPTFIYAEIKDQKPVSITPIVFGFGIAFFCLFVLKTSDIVSINIHDGFKQSAISIIAANSNYEKINTALVEKCLNDTVKYSAIIQDVKKISALSDTMCTQIRTIKSHIIAGVDFNENNSAMEIIDSYYKIMSWDNTDIPTRILCGKDDAGIWLEANLSELKQSYIDIVEKDSSLSRLVNLLLSTDNLYNQQNDETTWTNNCFWYRPALGVLNTLTRTELNVRIAESEILSQLIVNAELKSK